MVRDTAWRPGALKLRAMPYDNRRPLSPTQEITGSWLVALVVLLLGGTPAAATCVDASTLAHSTVSITRYFAEDEKRK